MTHTPASRSPKGFASHASSLSAPHSSTRRHHRQCPENCPPPTGAELHPLTARTYTEGTRQLPRFLAEKGTPQDVAKMRPPCVPERPPAVLRAEQLKALLVTCEKGQSCPSDGGLPCPPPTRRWVVPRSPGPRGFPWIVLLLPDLGQQENPGRLAPVLRLRKPHGGRATVHHPRIVFMSPPAGNDAYLPDLASPPMATSRTRCVDIAPSLVQNRPVPN